MKSRLGTRLGRLNLISLISLPLIVVMLLLFLATSNTLQVTTDQTLSQYWRSSYDLLIRPPGSRSLIEAEHHLVRANFLSGTSGGITHAEYETIRALPEVDIAAPVAMVGYRYMEPTVVNLSYLVSNPEYHGQYRIELTQSVDDGLQERKYKDVIEDWNSLAQPGYAFNFQVVNWERWPAFVAGIDPQAEVQLTALDRALRTSNQLLNDFPPIHRISNFGQSTYYVPLLLNLQSAFLIDILAEVYHSDTDALEWARTFRFGDPLLQPEVMLMYRSPNSMPTRSSFTTVDPCHSEMPTAVQYRPVTRPAFLPEHSITFEAVPTGSWEQEEVTFRDLTMRMALDCEFNHFGPLTHGNSWYLHTPIGEYDSQQLFAASDRLLRNLPLGTTHPLSPEEETELVRSALNRLPFETYFLPETVLKYYPDGTLVSPPATLRPTLNRQGYLTTPPTALTTLEAAQVLNPQEDYISAIRVRVGQITEMDAEAQAKIQRVAEQIVEQTGLEVDIMAGTSPRSVYVYLPGYEDIPPLGWVEEQWVQKGVTTAVSRGFRRADLLLSSAVFGVVGLFLVTSQLLSVLGRTRQWGILRALGWRATTLFRTVLQEALLLGIVAGMLALGGGFVAIRYLGLDVPLERLSLLMPVALALYGGGALYPAWRASRMAPIAAVQQGELSGRGSRLGRLSLLGYGLRHLGQQRLRTVLLLLQLTLASALAVLLGAVLIAVQGELYGNLLGQHLYTKIGPTQLAQAGLGLLLAALAVAEVLRTSVAERRREIGVLKALGWRSRTLLRAVMSEAALLGLLGGTLGALLGTGAFWGLYRELPSDLLWVVPGGVLLCIGVSILAALWPATQAARIPPAEAVRYE